MVLETINHFNGFEETIANFQWFLRRLSPLNVFWRSDHCHQWFFNGFWSCYHRFQWFLMVLDHWSNDAMVSMDRYGLVGPMLLKNPVPMCQYFLPPCIYSLAMAVARYVSDTLAKPDNCYRLFFTPMGPVLELLPLAVVSGGQVQIRWAGLAWHWEYQIKRDSKCSKAVASKACHFKQGRFRLVGQVWLGIENTKPSKHA